MATPPASVSYGVGFVIMDPVGIHELLTDEHGGIAQKMEDTADLILVKTRISLSVPGGRHISGGRNPPPGPPRWRSGDLIRSLRRTEARNIGGELTVLCQAPAVHRGWYYGQILVDRGYQFVDLTSLP